MCATKFEQPVYKVYDPGYHSQQPFVVEDALDSPETLAIRLEEEAANGGGGQYQGLPMSVYKAPPMHGYADSPYSQYSTQSFSTQQSENAAVHVNAASQMNQIAFAANGAATSQYLATATVGPRVDLLSSYPSVGSEGTKVTARVSSQYDLLSMTSSTPYVYLAFGSQRCAAQMLRDSQDSSGGCIYTVTAEAPGFLSTGCPSFSNVPLTLVVESSSGELARAESNIATFSYSVHHRNDQNRDHQQARGVSAGGGGGGVGGGVGGGGVGHHQLQHDVSGGTGASSASAGVGGSGDVASPPDLGTPVKTSRSPVHHRGHRASPPQSLHGRTDTVSDTSAAAAPTSQAAEVGAATNTAPSHAAITPTSPSSSPQHALGQESATNTYGYPPPAAAAASAAALQQAQAQAQAQAQVHAHAQAQAQQAQAQAQSNFATYSPGDAVGSSMLGSYRGPASFADQYSRAPPSLRPPQWSPYATNPLDSLRSPIMQASLSRPSLTPLVNEGPTSPTGSNPHLVRTSTVTSGAAGMSGGGGAYHSMYGPVPAKASLKIHGNLKSMAENWTDEEWTNKRRIVLFKRSQQGSQITSTFRAVSVTERPPNSICISCIWWAEKKQCYVTSVDTIHLLEQLVSPRVRFCVEEKNRIRRNLEGFHPLTVSKGRPESEEFFKVIMGFGNPKPRNIEKDVKVFSWNTLAEALTKIINKYCAKPEDGTGRGGRHGHRRHHHHMSHHHHHHPHNLLTPVSLGAPAYPALPPTPVSSTGTTTTDTASATGYVSTSQHHADTLASPRSLSGAPSWGAYAPGPGRAPSPVIKAHSPISTAGLRISTLSAVYDTRSNAGPASLASPYGLANPGQHSTQQAAYGQSTSAGVTPGSHHNAGAGRGSWDAYPMTADNYGGPPSHSTHSQVYGATVGYGDGSHRV